MASETLARRLSASGPTEEEGELEPDAGDLHVRRHLPGPPTNEEREERTGGMGTAEGAVGDDLPGIHLREGHG